MIFFKNKENMNHLNVSGATFLFQPFLDILKFGFISDWQIYKMAGSKLLEAF